MVMQSFDQDGTHPKKHIGKAFCNFLNQSKVWVVKEYGICTDEWTEWEDVEFLDKEHYHFIILEDDYYQEPSGILANHITTQYVNDIDALISYYDTQIESGNMENIGSNDDEFWY